MSLLTVLNVSNVAADALHLIAFFFYKGPLVKPNDVHLSLANRHFFSLFFSDSNLLLQLNCF